MSVFPIRVSRGQDERGYWIRVVLEGEGEEVFRTYESEREWLDAWARLHEITASRDDP